MDDYSEEEIAEAIDRIKSAMDERNYEDIGAEKYTKS